MAESKIKYDQRGNEYRIMIVRDNECLAMRDGRMWILPKSILSDDPPQQEGAGEIAEAKAALADLNERVETARIILATIEKTAAEHLARLGQQRPALKHLDDFLAGRITHFVETRYDAPPWILTWDDAKTFNGKVKLLTLFGDSNGDVAWKQSQYSDGTGYTVTVIPCVSRDEALGEVVKIFSAHEVDALHPKHKTTPDRQWVEQATKYGLSMTDGYMRALERLESSARQAKVAKLQSEIQTLKEGGGNVTP